MPSKLKVDEIEVASASTVKLNSTLAVDTIKDASATNTLVEQSGADWKWGSGVPSSTILQIVQSTKSDTASSTSASFVDIVGTDQAGSGSVWCCKITPSATSSKILVNFSINFGGEAGGFSPQFQMFRDSTQIYMGDERSDRTRSWIGGLQYHDLSMQNVHAMYLDSPSSTSELLYKAKYRTETTAYEIHVNKNETDSDTSQYFTTFSNIMLMEIAG